MTTGIVRRWNEERGFGFIAADDARPGERDCFVHRTDIWDKKITALQVDSRVDFDRIETAKGPKAVNVRILSL